FAAAQSPPDAAGDSSNVERLVEGALAVLEQRDRLAEADAPEMLGLAVRLARVLVRVLLVDEEHARVLGIHVGLVEEAAGLGARGAGQPLERVANAVLLALLRRPFGGQDVCHLSPF